MDDTIKGYPNIASVRFRKDEGAYLAGVAAASQTKTGKLVLLVAKIVVWFVHLSMDLLRA